MTINKIDNTDISAVELLQNINTGLTDPKLLDKLSRQRCIELLIAEGYRRPQISQVLKVSEKTVNRDMKEIRARNELTPDIGFAKQTIGDFFQKAINHHAYLTRLARSKEANTSEKVSAEYAAWRVLRELVDKFQSLGYLPSRPTEIVSDIFHHSDKENTPEEMRQMIYAIEESGKEAGILNKEVKEKIKTLKTRIDQSEIVLDIKQLEKNTNNKKENDDE